MAFLRDPQFDRRASAAADTWDQTQAGVIVRGDYFGEFLAAMSSTTLEGVSSSSMGTVSGTPYDPRSAESNAVLDGAGQLGRAVVLDLSPEYSPPTYDAVVIDLLPVGSVGPEAMPYDAVVIDLMIETTAGSGDGRYFAGSATLAGAASSGAFVVGDPGPAREAESAVTLAGVVGTSAASVTVSAAQAGVLDGTASSGSFFAAVPFVSEVLLDGCTGTGAFDIARTVVQDIAFDGVTGAGAAAITVGATQSISLDGAVGAGAATLLTHAAQARALAGVSGSGAATVSLSAAGEVQLQGVSQTTKAGPVVTAQSAATLEGAAAEAAYKVITYAQATAALDGAAGSAAATVRVTGSVQTWLAGVQSEAEALVLVRAGADAALEGVASIAALLRFGERNYFDDVSAVSVPAVVFAPSHAALVFARTEPLGVAAFTSDQLVFANE